MIRLFHDGRHHLSSLRQLSFIRGRLFRYDLMRHVSRSPVFPESRSFTRTRFLAGCRYCPSLAPTVVALMDDPGHFYPSEGTYHLAAKHGKESSFFIIRWVGNGLEGVMETGGLLGQMAEAGVLGDGGWHQRNVGVPLKSADKPTKAEIGVNL